jgi:hypothetical protein
MKKLADTSFIGSIELEAALSKVKTQSEGDAETIKQAIAYIARTSVMLSAARRAVAN